MLTPYMAVIGKRHIVQPYRHWQRRKTLRKANRLISVFFLFFSENILAHSSSENFLATMCAKEVKGCRNKLLHN